MSRRIEIVVPDALADELEAFGGPVEDLLTLGLRQARILDALNTYATGGISFSRASEVAGVSRAELIRYARAFDVEPRWSDAMATEELA